MVQEITIRMTLFAIFGFLGNTIIIYKFLRMKEGQLNFHRIMVLLSFYYNILIITDLLLFVLFELSEAYRSLTYIYIFPKVFPIARVAITGSIYCTIAITIERYLAVCCPFYALSHRWSAKRYIIPIVIFSVVYNLPIFFEFETINPCRRIAAAVYEMHNNTETSQQSSNQSSVIQNQGLNPKSRPKIHKKCLNNDTSDDIIFRPTSIRLDYTYYAAYHIGCEFLFKCIFPFALLIVLNILMIRNLILNATKKQDMYPLSNLKEAKATLLNLKEVKQSARMNVMDTRHNEVFLAKVNLVIVFFFIVCHSVRWIIIFNEMWVYAKYGQEVWSARNWSEARKFWPLWIDTAKAISNSLIMVTSGLNCVPGCLSLYRSMFLSNE